MSQDVYVVVEHLNREIADVTFELLGKGRELASTTGGDLVAVLLHSGMADAIPSLGAANRVISVESAALAEFNPDTWGDALADLVEKKEPKLVLIGNTSTGMDLAAPLSVPKAAVPYLVRLGLYRPSHIRETMLERIIVSELKAGGYL